VDPASAAADELYGLPLESFTRERNRVAAELRQRGEKEAAAAVAALAKPTLAAWAVNQLARNDAREVDLLLDASHRLIETQGGRQSRDELASAQQRQRLALENLVRAARRVLGARATEPTLRKVAETLRSASITPDGRELLARGRLTDALSSTGWDVVVAKAAATPAAPKGTKKGSAAPPAAARARVAKAREELRLAREAHAEAGRRLREAEVERDRVRTQLRQAERKLDQLERALAAADEALNAAKSRLDDLHEDR
jgi:uncharacterized protein YhaN